jgi:hypothetical protein
MQTTTLNSRLRNCLVTILELEGALGQTHLGPALHDEFSVLKEVVNNLNSVSVEENDVCRIEAATGRFLNELKETLGENAIAELSPAKLLQ